METNYKSHLLNIFHHGIARYWVHPLENHLIPKINSGQQNRVQLMSSRSASWLANIGRVAVLDMRLRVVRWIGKDWSVTYIGEGDSREVLQAILFPEPPEIQELPNASLWQVDTLIRDYSAEDDLVVCEVNEILNWETNTPGIRFIVPQWIKQVLEEIDRPMDEILAGMNQSMRRKVRWLKSEDFSYTFTRDEGDFDLFFLRAHVSAVYPLPPRGTGRGPAG